MHGWTTGTKRRYKDRNKRNMIMFVFYAVLCSSDAGWVADCELLLLVALVFSSDFPTTTCLEGMVVFGILKIDQCCFLLLLLLFLCLFELLFVLGAKLIFFLAYFWFCSPLW